MNETQSLVEAEVNDQIAILHIKTNSIDAVSAAMIERAGADMRPITVLDFAEVTFINSAGISVLLKFVVNARKAGYRLFGIHLSPHHQKIFKMVEMTRFMPIINDEDLVNYQLSA